MIREYAEGDHPGGFIGIRVSVKVGRSQKQKYYSFRINRTEFISLREEQLLRLDTQKLEKIWLEEQKVIRSQREAEAKETARKSKPLRTGVRGIVLTYEKDNKFRAGEWRCYYYPVIEVNGSHNKIRFFTKFRIMTLGYDEAWSQAVIFYAKNKGIKFYGHLLKKKPQICQFENVRKYLNKHRNYGIPDMGHKLILADEKVKIIRKNKCTLIN